MPTDKENILKSELDTLRNIGIEMEKLFQVEAGVLEFKKRVLNVEKDILSDLVREGKISGQVYDANFKILGIEEKILKTIKAKEIPSKKTIESYKNALDELRKIEKSESNIKNLWAGIDKQTGGAFSKLKTLKKSLEESPELVVAETTLSIVSYLLENIWKTFENLDGAAADFRKSMGLTRDTSKQLEKITNDITIQYWSLGVAAKDVYESIKAVAETFGSTQFVTKELVKNMAVMSAQLGISAKTSAEFLKSMANISGTTADAQKEMLYFAQYMSSAAGVPLDAVMQDVAAATKSSYQFLPRTSSELVKAAVQAQRMGTSLQSAVASSSALLNFTQNVNDEMEASVLVGKSINLQRARQFAYDKNIRGLNDEILNIAKQTNFNSLDSFQQNAVAKALGKSADEVASMLESDRERQRVLKAMTPEQRQQYDLYQKALNASKEQTKDYAAQAGKLLEQESNQKAMAEISLAWQSILANIGKAILPSISVILRGIAAAINWIGHVTPVWMTSLAVIGVIFLGIVKTVKGLNTLLGAVGRAPIKLSSVLKPVVSIFEGIFRMVRGIGTAFTRFGGLSRFFAPLSRLFTPLSQLAKRVLPAILGVVGEIAGAFLAGFAIGKWINSFKIVQDYVQKFFLSLFKIGDGIEAVSRSIYEGLKKPFIAVWDWLKSTFLGNSPSQLGLMIVDGIMAVESMLIKALISPFETAWKFIKELPFVSHFLGGKDLSTNIKPDATAKVDIDKTSQVVDSPKPINNVTATVSDNNNVDVIKKMGEVVDAINGLRADFASGKLQASVHMDGQKLDSAMGRRLSYTGHLV